MLTACSSTTVPQIGAPVPCQIQSVEQVEQAVMAGLADQHWEVISSSAHIIEARKTKAQLQAMVHVLIAKTWIMMLKTIPLIQPMKNGFII